MRRVRRPGLKPWLAVRALVGTFAIIVCASLKASPERGLTGAPLVARAYDAILNADFINVSAALGKACGPAPREACRTLEAVGLFWRIALDPEDRSLDSQFSTRVDEAIAATAAWTTREPERAEAWFYHGAAYGARVQWRVLRGERLAAARDGKRIKEALERALRLDPEMHDAEFGIGLYRYYAAVAPTTLRMLRWLLNLPGGDRGGGLRQMMAASESGQLVRGEADYQLQIVYLWYEHRFDEALQLVDSLRARYPRNPLFHQARAEILDTYIHDQTASLGAWQDLIRGAQAKLVNEPELAAARARLRAAELLDQLDETDRAVPLLQQVIDENPRRPHDVVPAATTLLTKLRQRLAHEPYRMALDGWRAFERDDLETADRALTRSLSADPSNAVTRYRYAQLLTARHDDQRAIDELDRVIAAHDQHLAGHTRQRTLRSGANRRPSWRSRARDIALPGRFTCLRRRSTRHRACSNTRTEVIATSHGTVCAPSETLRVLRAMHLTRRGRLKLLFEARSRRRFDNSRRFVLDIGNFSPIIYIWYEGGGLRPPVVKA